MPFLKKKRKDKKRNMTRNTSRPLRISHWPEEDPMLTPEPITSEGNGNLFALEPTKPYIPTKEWSHFSLRHMTKG